MLMSRCRAGRKLAVAGVSLLAALSAAGCASDREYRREAYEQRAGAMQAVAARPRNEPELEDDGLPSQVPPPANRLREADDPREPFSPNYGKTAAAQPVAQPLPVKTSGLSRIAAH